MRIRKLPIIDYQYGALRNQLTDGGSGGECCGHTLLAPAPAVRDLTLDGRWSTYDVSVLKLNNVHYGENAHAWKHSKATITNKTRPAGSFSSS
jgi:hypothetical protein